MLAALRRWRIEGEDWLRYQPTVRAGLCRSLLLREALARPRDDHALANSVRRLCAAARLTGDEKLLRALEGRIRERVARLDASRLDWNAFVPTLDSPHLKSAAILKPHVGPREPGVVYSSFESEWVRQLVHCRDLAGFARDYVLVVAPCSSPYNLPNCVFPHVYPGPVWSQINHPEDMEIIPHLGPAYRMVPLYTSHWVSPDAFQPRPRSERDIDLVMVAAWGKVKRHHTLFRALRRMPAGLRVLLIGQDQEGRTSDTVRREAALYGVEGRFEVMTNAPHAAVVEALGRAKVSLLLSLREGSAVVVPESLFADTPVGLWEGCYNGSRDFINGSTGVLLRNRDLAGQLLDFLARADSFTPRKWAEANISCFQSTARLNDMLRAAALEAGQEWTRDLAPMCWRPMPRLVWPEREPWLAGERRAVHERFGLLIGPGPEGAPA
jgi:glycosyltransferase involved in cell wall biosynthesis